MKAKEKTKAAPTAPAAGTLKNLLKNIKKLEKWQKLENKSTILKVEDERERERTQHFFAGDSFRKLLKNQKI